MTTSDPFPEPEPGIDEIVRAQLDAEAARTDARGMTDRVFARLAADTEPAPPVRRGRVRRRVAALAGAAALAAAVLVAVFVFSGSREIAASPAQVVRGARDAYTRNDARCYRVTIDLPARARDSFPLLALDSGQRTLCTCGDRFVVEPGFGGKGAWGSDGTGRVWIAPSDEGAAAFDETELPPALRNAVKIHGLELGSLLDEVLADFELAWSEPPTRTAETYTVAATRRGETPPLRIVSAELVIEKGTKVVRSLTLHRRTLTEGTATLTFSLLATVSKDVVAFTPEGYIKPGAPVHDRTRAFLRWRLLVPHLGENVIPKM